MSIFIKNIADHVDSEVEVKGWVYNFRSSGKIAFLQLRDGTGFVQAVVTPDNVSEEAWNAVQEMTQESSVTVKGTVTKHPKKEDVYELQTVDVTVIQKADEYPIANKEHGPDFLMTQRHLWIRSQKQWAILRIRDAVETAIHNYLHSEDFIRVDSPVFTPNPCEGATELFEVPYFDMGSVFLSQSGQLYSEAAISSVGRCYDFGPVFRAEKSTTKRHLTEFWMMDAEAAFVEHDDNLAIQEGLVKAIMMHCLENCKKELAILERDTAPLEAVANKPFTRYTYDEAIIKLNELGSDIKHGEDLGNDDEGMLTKDSDVPVFIEKWPKGIKPFYMKEDPENDGLVLNNDLIATEGAGEISGGSQREDNAERLLERIREEKLDESVFDWYLDLRKFGSVPHSGFGIGLERIVRWVSGTQHIRECTAFPRLVNRIRP
jgi:asparaginyl-tRNA synthetase